MDEAIKQEILLQTDEEGLHVSIRVHALEQAVKWVNQSDPSDHVINVAKKFETYLRGSYEPSA